MTQGSRNRGRTGTPVPPRGGLRDRIDAFGGPLVIGSIAAALLVVVALVVLNRPRSSANQTAYVPRPHAQVAGRVAGKPDASITIIEYADFQCPFCRRHWNDTLPMIEQDYIAAGIASYEYRPIAILGAESRDAAAASLCAQDQGLFWEYHDILYLRQGNEHSGVYSRANLKTYAKQMTAALASRPFDQSAFEACVDSGGKYAEIAATMTEAGKQGVASTPTFIINGRKLEGALPPDQFRGVLEQVRAGR